MAALGLCALALVVTYWAGKRSLAQGLIALMVFGYFYGIVRANINSPFSHFIFDAGLLGLYLSQKWSSRDPKEARQLKTLRIWVALLMLWPCLLVLLPFQPLMVSIVGLRGSIFFLPVLLLGARLRHRDLMQFAAGLAVLDLIALSFAIAEYFLSVTRFYPYSAVTQIIYASGDVAGGYLRIPAVFSSAHAYGGTMVTTLPYLLGLWSLAESRLSRLLGLAGMAAVLIGVLMSATRQNFIFASAMLITTVLAYRVKTSYRIIFLALIAAVGIAAMMNPRFQRFKSLGDTEAVEGRIAGSVNRGFFEILFEYPMGNGLGGGGTSMPYFLAGQIRNPIGMENEYARILSEQGIIGLLLWLGFIGWFLSRGSVLFEKGSWANSRRLIWCFSTICLGTAWIGLGLFTSIPGTVILLLGMGWTATKETAQPAARRVRYERTALRLGQEGAVLAG